MTDTLSEILLVEDDPRDVKLAVRALKEYAPDSTVYVTRDGVEALDFLFRRGVYSERNGNDPQLILLDLKLPLLDGHQVLQQLKSSARFRTIPVVMLTSSLLEDDVQRSYELGVNSYVAKPVDFEMYSSVVRQVGEYWLEVNRQPAR